MKAIAVPLLLCVASLVACERSDVDVADRRATRVAVSDAEHHQVQLVTGAADLAAFNAHWLTKRDTGKTNAGVPIENFQFFIDVEAKAGGGRWLYSTDGSVVKLDKRARTLYQVSEAKEFNRVLGVVR